MAQIKLAFVANDGNAYAPETEIGKQLGYITWTPSKIRVILSSGYNNQKIHISQESLQSEELRGELNSILKSLNKENIKYETPEVLFYNNLEDEGSNKIELTGNIVDTKYCQTNGIFEDVKSIEFYVGGKFKKDVIYGGASAQEKDIKILTWYNGDPLTVVLGEDAITTMIRVRRNANELTKKAKEDYLKALSEINKRDKEGIGLGVYSTDFFAMHVKGSKSIAHGSSVFLPWHRLYLLDLERTLQQVNNNVSLHYWKFDEPAPNIFKDDFLGETISDKASTPLMTEGFGDNFAKFSDSNPLKNWSIGREKLIRRKTWFNNQEEQSGYNKGGNNPFYLKKEYNVYYKDNKELRQELFTDDELPYSKVFAQEPKKDRNNLDSFTGMELNPHGEAHTSINGFLNYVPTAPKDPIFFFLHSNVDRLWAQWQTLINNGFDYTNKNTYKEMPSLSWTRVDEELWPWKRESTPNNYHMIPPGTRSENFSKSFLGKKFPTNVPKIADAIDAFGVLDNNNNLGFGYDTFDKKFEFNSNKLGAFLNNVVEDTLGNQSNIVVPNIVHFSNNRLLSKIVSDNANLIDNSVKITETNSLKSFSKESNSNLLRGINHENGDKINFFVDVNNYSQYLRDIDYLEAAHNYDINVLGEVEHQFDILSLKASSRTKISKHLVIYIMAIINNEKIQDDNIFEFVKNNIKYLSNISAEEVLDVKIALYSFASNSLIKHKIIPEFFAKEDARKFVYGNREIVNKLKKELRDENPKEDRIKEIYKEISELKVDLEWDDVDTEGLDTYLNDLKSKSDPNNLDMESPYIHENDTPEEKEHKNTQYRASMANKYWALYTLLTNAGVVVNTNVEEFANADALEA